MLHAPKEERLQRLLPELARDRPDLLDAYQGEHHKIPAGVLRKRPETLVFVKLGGGGYAFVGHRRVVPTSRTTGEVRADPLVRELVEDFGCDFDLSGPDDEPRPWFAFELTGQLAALEGRLVITPRPAPWYVHNAEVLDPPVAALERESRLDPPVPDWRSLCPTGPEVRVLPRSWETALAEWRGIYLIVDERDGARYVGSANGALGFLGRWRQHVAREAEGITAQLRERDPLTFRFSILERVIDMPTNDVTRLEQTWMDRLHTRRFGLNAGAPGLVERTGNG